MRLPVTDSHTEETQQQPSQQFLAHQMVTLRKMQLQRGQQDSGGILLGMGWGPRLRPEFPQWRSL